MHGNKNMKKNTTLSVEIISYSCTSVGTGFQKCMEKVSVCQGSNSRPGGLPERSSCHSNKTGVSVEVGGWAKADFLSQDADNRLQTPAYEGEIHAVYITNQQVQSSIRELWVGVVNIVPSSPDRAICYCSGT